MRGFKEKFKAFCARPTTFAYAGRLFIVPKLVLALVAMVMAKLYFRNVALEYIVLLSYPLVALIIDLLLYGFRTWIWPNLPDADLIPSHWHITPAQLQQYAQSLPKVRLLRTLLVAILCPLIAEEWTLASLAETFGCLFFFAALFDGCCLKYLHLQGPKQLKIQIVLNPKPTSWMDDDDERHNRMRQTDATIPGTTAWVAAQNTDRVRTSLDNWPNHSSNLPIPTNPTHIHTNPTSSGANTWPPY